MWVLKVFTVRIICSLCKQKFLDLCRHENHEAWTRRPEAGHPWLGITGHNVENAAMWCQAACDATDRYTHEREETLRHN